MKMGLSLVMSRKCLWMKKSVVGFGWWFYWMVVMVLLNYIKMCGFLWVFLIKMRWLVFW